MRSDIDGTVEITLPMNSNDIVLVKLVRSEKGDSNPHSIARCEF